VLTVLVQSRYWLWHMADSTIDAPTLAAAERLFGIQYTDAERTQMMDNLAGRDAIAQGSPQTNCW
jgi:hypothetical protein